MMHYTYYIAPYSNILARARCSQDLRLSNILNYIHFNGIFISRCVIMIRNYIIKNFSFTSYFGNFCISNLLRSIEGGSTASLFNKFRTPSSCIVFCNLIVFDPLHHKFAIFRVHDIKKMLKDVSCSSRTF